MLYLLFEWIERTFAPPGFQVFQFSTVRAGLAAGTALLVALFAGKKIIRYLRTKQIGETVREGENAGVVSHAHKKGTPTMGGVILLLALASGVLLWADLRNAYVWIALGATLWMGAFGFADDYIKVVKKDKDGIAPKVKLAGQLSLGALVALLIVFVLPADGYSDTFTSLPLVPDGGIDYDFLSPLVGVEVGWLIYIPVITFILTGVSNAVNLTDGLDGLATMPVIIAAGTFALIAYLVGRVDYSSYLGIPHVPGAGELAIFCAAIMGAGLAFLWFNAPPAAVFMGDTGSLALGGALGAIAVATHHEVVLAVVGGLFVFEALSVIIQVFWFKRTGKRVFRMAPIHHHFEQLGWSESKVVIRFWIVAIVLAILGLATLKLR